MSSNKESSYKQEHMLSKYMGWNVVSGSGARPFALGDVASEYFLAECKTHNSLQKSIVFKADHWNKIVIEARSSGKRPLLVTDNGSQDFRYTWVMLPLNVITNCISINVIDGLNNTSRSGNTVTFDEADAHLLYANQSKNNQLSVFITKWKDSEEYNAILPLVNFKLFFEEIFN